MKRWIACGVGAGWVSVAVAAQPVPVSVYPPVPAAPATAMPSARVSTLPGTVVPAPTRPVGATGPLDVTKPLSSVLETIPPLPTTPTVPAPAYATGLPAGDCGPAGESCGTPLWGGSRFGRLSGPTPCLDKLRAYFAWQPGCRVGAVCTPTPYQPPLRHYFPVSPAPHAASTGSAAPAAGCSSFFGPRLLGFARGAGCGGRRCDPCHENVLEKACAAVTPRQFNGGPRSRGCPDAAVSACAGSSCGPTSGGSGALNWAAPAVGGIYPGVGGGYRFASPVFVPPAPAVTASGGAGQTGGGIGGGGAVSGGYGSPPGGTGGGTGSGFGGGSGVGGGTGR